jgi:hypothetical protein
VDIDDIIDLTRKFDFCVEIIIPRTRTFVSVEIHVVNDKDNIITSPKLKRTQCMVAIFENSPMGEFVFSVPTCFSYQGQPETTTYAIIGGNYNDAFSVDSNGTITVNAIVDYERQTQYNLSVLIQDQSASSVTIDIIVQIMDVNDNGPLFEMPEYFIQVEENTTVGTVLFNANAMDADSGVNSILTYSFVNESNDYVFCVNSQSGDVYVAKSLYYKVKKIYRLSLSVSDLGMPVLTAYAKVVIEVVRVNNSIDNFPNHRTYFGRVLELSPKGTVVVNIASKDVDDMFSYKIDSQSNSDNSFEITDGGNVVVATSRLIYIKSNNIYNLSVVAYDGSRQLFTSTVTIEVLELFNRNTPQFLNGTAVILQIPDSTEKDSKVGRLVAVDGDEGLAGELTYRIISDSSNGLFDVELHSGYFTVKASLDSGSVGKMYLIVVEGKDGGTAKHNSTKKSTVNVTVFVYNSTLIAMSHYTPATSSAVLATSVSSDDSVCLSTDITTGIAAGVFVLLIAVTLIFIKWRRKLKQRSKDIKSEEQCVEVYLTLSNRNEQSLSALQVDNAYDDIDIRPRHCHLPTPRQSHYSNARQLPSELSRVNIKNDDLQENQAYGGGLQKNAAYGVV